MSVSTGAIVAGLCILGIVAIYMAMKWGR